MSKVLTPGACPKRTAFSGTLLLALTVTCGVIVAGGPGDAFGQWRRKTPRDTVKVAANSSAWKPSKMALAAGYQIYAKYLGTFGMYTGQAGTGFDAKYTYKAIPGWSTPLPLENPPTFNGRTEEIYLAINRESPDLKPNGEKVKFNETSYQSSHEYTGLHTSLGIPLNYRIYAKDNARYGAGTGQVTVELAQWTAGISMRSQVLNFGTTNIGASKTLPDSIASYGIDPLAIDSVRIRLQNGNPAPDFTFTSQRNAPFTLPNEAVNEFQITYTPTSRGQLNAFLYIYCKNTDGANRIKVVQLSGYGVAPEQAITPDKLDFGRVRVNSSETKYVVIENKGNGPLEITSATFTGDPVFTSRPVPSVAVPMVIQANSTRTLEIIFTPTARRKYRGVVTIKGKNVPQDSVILNGEGTDADFVLSDTILNFGPVRRNDKALQSFKIYNRGGYAANILHSQIDGPNKAAYEMTPNQTKFQLAAGDSIEYTVKFEPTTGPEGSRLAWVEFALDDGKPAREVQLIGFEVEPKMLLGRTLVDFGFVKVGRTKWDTVSMFNNSNASLPFSDVFVRADQGSLGIFNYDNAAKPTNLKPNAYDSLRLSFSPTARQSFGAWVHTNVNGQKDSIYVTGTGVLPVAVFDPPQLDFGVVPTSWSSNLFTSLTDTGDYKMEVCDVEVTGADASYFTITNTNPVLPVMIEPFDNKMNIAVQFKTDAATGRTYSAWLKVIYCDGSTDSIRLLAKEQAQMLQFGQRVVDFGKVRVKEQLDKPAILSNGSNTALAVGSLYITGTPPYFTTTATSAVVEKKSQGEVMVKFAPLTRGDFEAQLHATGGDIETDAITLKGIGAAPMPKFSDTVINFGTVVPPANKLMNLTVDNVGNWWMKAKVSIENDLYNEFSVTTSGMPYDSVGEGGQLIYPITFKPNTPQLLHTADLKFTLDDSSTYIVKLIGKDEYEYISIDSTHVNFNKVRVGTTRTVRAQLVNTWSAIRTAEDIAILPQNTVFSATPTGQVDVESRSMKPIDITFAPPALGTFSSMIIAKGGDVLGEDTVYLEGIGAAPKLALSQPLVDFGTLVVGDTRTLQTTISNEGNWDMHITNIELRGANRADFSFDLKTDTTIAEAGVRSFNISFLATTALQPNPRTADLVFTLDDGTEHTLPLTALDKAPIITDIGFGEYYARPGDMIYAVMRLKTQIPEEIASRRIKGTVEYDPTLIDLQTIEKFGIMTSSDWSLDTAQVRTPGIIDFELSSTSAWLRDPGALLRIVFQAKKDLTQTAQSTLRLTLLDYLDTRELVASLNDGTIIIDSSCGSPQIIAGDGSPAAKSWIEQNRPNPFGVTLGSGQTSIFYDIAKDDAQVTIRVLDATGREVIRPVDQRTHSKGYYNLSIDAHRLGAGTYFYEFHVTGEKPIVRKMIVKD